MWGLLSSVEDTPLGGQRANGDLHFWRKSLLLFVLERGILHM